MNPIPSLFYKTPSPSTHPADPQRINIFRKQIDKCPLVADAHLESAAIKRGSITQICCHFKTQECLSVSKIKEIIVKFVINYYHPSAIKLLISSSGQRQSRSQWIET